MRIGLSTSVIQRGKTGVAQYVLSLARAFCEEPRGHEFVLFVLEEDLPLFDFARGRCRIETTPESVRPALRNIAWHQTTLPGLVRQMGIEVMHVPSYRRLLWRRPCAMVGTIHDLAPFRVRGKYDVARMLYCRKVIPVLARRQHRLIAVSEATAGDIRAFLGVDGRAVSVVHNGIDHRRFFPGAREDAQARVKQRHGLAGPYVLYVARLEHPAKNHVRLIQAFARFKAETGLNWGLVLGGSDWAGAEHIHEEARKSACSADIRFLGFVKDDDIPDLYRAAEHFIYPSLFEGFGLPPLEAMACGCPVVCSDRGSLREVIGKDAAVIVDPDKVESITAGLRQMANERERAARIAAGLAWAARFRWERAAEETIRVYEAARL